MATAVKTVSDAAKDNPGAAFLVTSITVIAGVFTALGLTGNVLGRMARNHSLLAGASIITALVAVILGVLAALLVEHTRARWSILGVGLFFFAAAGGFAVWAAISTWGDETRPQVTATVQRTPRGLVLGIKAKMNGLEARQRLRVSVWPVVSESGSALVGAGEVIDPYTYEVEGLPLHRSINGPDADGDVDYAVDVPLPPQHPPRVVVQAATGSHRPEDCFEKGSSTGCVLLYLGEPGRPQLKGSWGSASSSEGLAKLQIVTEDIPTATVYVRAVGVPSAGARRVHLAVAQFPPGASGDVISSLEVVVPRSVGAVCAVASTVKVAARTCPPLKKEPRSVLRDCVRSSRRSSQVDPPPTAKQLRRSCQRSWAAFVEHSTSWIRLRAPQNSAN
jgi:hypothetical protein